MRYFAFAFAWVFWAIPLATTRGWSTQPALGGPRVSLLMHLVADIRIASAETRFGQDENTHGRFPGGGLTTRFVVGWGNAMRVYH
jgi:1,4-dihydroxy-2-naphthoyl-CoA synthase